MVNVFAAKKQLCFLSFGFSKLLTAVYFHWWGMKATASKILDEDCSFMQICTARKFNKSSKHPKFQQTHPD